MKHVVVSGAGSGIGLACAKWFLGQGWSVSFNVFSDENEQAAKLEASAAPERTQVIRGDVAHDADCRAIASAALEKFGRIDALINAAGITRFCDEANLEGLNAEDFHAIYAVNSIGTFQLARACAPALKASRGAIVNLSSYAGIHGGGSSLAYGASKAAVNAITLSLARALAPEVRVNAVCPALVAQGFVERLQPESFAARSARQRERTPLQKVGEPHEVAQTIYCLVTGSPLITGEIIQLDAGLHLAAR